MSTPRGRDYPGDEKPAAGDSMCIPGLGDNKPRPRVLGTSFFGYVPDAFSMKTPDLPSERNSAASSKRQSQVNIALTLKSNSIVISILACHVWRMASRVSRNEWEQKINERPSEIIPSGKGIFKVLYNSSLWNSITVKLFVIYFTYFRLKKKFLLLWKKLWSVRLLPPAKPSLWIMRCVAMRCFLSVVL